MSTKIEVDDANDQGGRLLVIAATRTLNAEEYKELSDAIRALQKVTDKYIYGAPVHRPDEAEEDV